ncbi:MAG: hypothetical protein ACQEWW_20725 [Bacillota bacterium]|jgi:hypothetical protein
MVILIKIPPAFLIELPALKENASIEKDRPFYNRKNAAVNKIFDFSYTSKLRFNYMHWYI